MIQPPVRRGFVAADAVPAQPDPEATVVPESTAQRYPVEVTAKAGEYFRIWIVNLALTVVTLGIYSAWAKVRKRRYFYANTRIDGEGFEYRANPVAILKGRLLALGALALVYVPFKFMPLSPLHAVLVIAAVFALPWLIVRAQAFNAYNTAYRNIRFRFDGTYKRCLGLLVGYGLLMIVTLGLAYFFLRVRMLEFIIRHHHYGATRFEVPDLKPPLFRVYGKLIGLGFLGGILMALLFVLLALLAGGSKPPPAWYVISTTVISYALYLFLFCYARSRVSNTTWGLVQVGGLRFESRLGARRLFWIYLTNILAIAATLGLATPWAVVRTLRYRASCMTVIAATGLGEFMQAQAAQVGASGEEVAEAFDVDFGL